MEEESRAKFINDFYAHQAMYLALKMADIEAEIGHCIVKSPDMPGDIGMFFNVCIADGRIWDVAFHFAIPQPCEKFKEAMAKWPVDSLFPAKSQRVYLPLPSDDDIKSHPLGLRKEIKRAKEQYHLTLGIGTIPELDPFFTDKKPYQELVITREAREMMNDHYMDIDDRESIIKLYGKGNIESLMEESFEEFQERLDSFIEEYPDTDQRSRQMSRFEEQVWQGKKLKIQMAFHFAENKQEIIERNKKTVTRFTDLIDPNRVKKSAFSWYTCPWDSF